MKGKKGLLTEFAPNFELDKPQEECGVFGIYAPGEPVRELTYLGMTNLQHRGQQGAGMSVSDGELIHIYQDLGLVKEVFNHGLRMPGFNPDDQYKIATGHNRYGTADTPDKIKLKALQPMPYLPGRDDLTDFVISHNGHVEGLEDTALARGIELNNPASDTVIMKEIIGREYEQTGNMQEALVNTLPLFDGAYSLVLSTFDELIAVRDPHGFRPLHLGKYQDKGWVVASEIAALDIAKAVPIREVQPGEILTISGPSETDLSSIELPKKKPALCGFEFVYFSRPDNEMYGEAVTEVRKRMGRFLAEKDTVEADMVLGVPESGRAAAKGYAQASGIPDEDHIVRNIYVDRSFIAPNQDMRGKSARNKFNVIDRFIKDQRLIVVDDSIVRGTTTLELVQMLRNAGAAEVHMRISSPPYMWPCFYGMDTSRREELIAANMTEDEIRDYIDADSLMFLTNKELQQSVGTAAGKICTACTTGIYPIETHKLNLTL